MLWYPLSLLGLVAALATAAALLFREHARRVAAEAKAHESYLEAVEARAVLSSERARYYADGVKDGRAKERLEAAQRAARRRRGMQPPPGFWPGKERLN